MSNERRIQRITTDETLNILQRGRDKIAAGKWCQGSYVELGTNNFCAVGAIGYHITYDTHFPQSYDALAYLANALNKNLQLYMAALTPFIQAGHIIHFNDTHTREEVVALFDRAIQLRMANLTKEAIQAAA